MDSPSTGSITPLLAKPFRFLTAALSLATNQAITQPLLPCRLSRNRKNASFGDFKFDDLTLNLSSNTGSDSQVGLQAFKNLKSNENWRLAVGFKRVINNTFSYKSKFDTDWNAQFYSEYKFDNGVALQSTIASNLFADLKGKGFLGNNFILGAKVKYDS